MNQCQSEDISLTNVIKNFKKYDLSQLTDLEGKTGVYIFSIGDEVVYVGRGGVQARDLKYRISQELKANCKASESKYSVDTGATLSKNIQKIDTKTPDESVEIIQTMTLKVCFSEKSDDNKNYAIRLEHLLIGIYNPKYNRG